MTPDDLPELIVYTDLDVYQLAHIARLPLALVAGCHDALMGATDGLRTLGRYTCEEWRTYALGQAVAVAWAQARAPPDGEPPF